MVGSGRGSAVSVALGGRAEIKGAWPKCCCALDLIFRHLDRHKYGVPMYKKQKVENVRYSSLDHNSNSSHMNTYLEVDCNSK